jgi:hypothetical protein
MTPAQSTPDEARRIDALRRYAVLDTLPEQPLDDLAILAAQICEVPIASITLIDEYRQWFKARVAKGEVVKVLGTAVKHFLPKPYTAGTLLKVIRTILDET